MHRKRNENGILACGFMRKETAERSQYHFSNAYYSCFVLLRGSGRYLSETGTSYQLQAGSLVQRLPGVPHSTIIHPDGKWLEFFISIGKPFFKAFCSIGVYDQTPVQTTELFPGDLERYQKLLRKLKAAPTASFRFCSRNYKEILRMHGYHTHPEKMQRDPVEIACDALSQNLEEEISMEELASSLQLDMKPSESVQKQTGISPARYRTGKNGAGLYSS